MIAYILGGCKNRKSGYAEKIANELKEEKNTKFKNEKNFYEWLPQYSRGYSVIFDKFNNIYYNKI